MVRRTVTLIKKTVIILEGANVFDIEAQAKRAARHEKADEFDIETYVEEIDRKFPVVTKFNDDNYGI